MKSLILEKDDIYISVDYRTELLGILMTISDYERDNPNFFNDGYANDNFVADIEQQFLRYKSHKTVLLFNELYYKGLSVCHAFNLFLNLNDNLECDNIPQEIVQAVKDEDSLKEFVSSLKDFSKDINFEHYYISNSSKYVEFIKSASRLVDGSVSEFLGDYYGLENVANCKMILNLLPFATNEGFGISVGNSMYANRSVSKYGRDDDMFFDGECGLNLKSNMIYEYSHGFLNNYIELNDEVNKPLYEKLSEETPKGYEKEDDLVKLIENIIRAISARYVARTYGKDEYESRLDYEKSRGFSLIEDIANRTISVEDNDLTIYDIYPSMIHELYENKKM